MQTISIWLKYHMYTSTYTISHLLICCFNINVFIYTCLFYVYDCLRCPSGHFDEGWSSSEVLQFYIQVMCLIYCVPFLLFFSCYFNRSKNAFLVDVHCNTLYTISITFIVNVIGRIFNV